MNITGEASVWSTLGFFSGNYEGASGAFYKGTIRNECIQGTNATNSSALGFDASRSWTGSTSEEGGEESRPDNATMIVWLRTA